jgi:hypothetical protein
MHSIRTRLVGYCATVALLACAGLGTAAYGSATLYKWVDSDGVTHYSDRPAPGAVQVHIANAQTYKSIPVTAPNQRTPSGTPRGAKYSRVQITSPTDGQSFVDTGGKVDVAADVAPALAPANQLWFQIDGTRQPEPAGPGYTASFEVARGTHTAAAVITDADGHELITSAPVTFYVLQHSVAAPPRGPAITPPAKKP